VNRIGSFAPVDPGLSRRSPADFFAWPFDSARRTLLNNMGQLVGQERTARLSVRGELAPAKHDIGTDREGAGTDGCRCGIRSRVGMNPHAAEVVAEAWLHKAPGS